MLFGVEVTVLEGQSMQVEGCAQKRWKKGIRW